MQNTLFMSLGNLVRKKHSPCQILRNLSRDQISLRGGHHGILIGIFLHHIFIAVLNQAENGFICRVRLAHQSPGIAVDNICFGQSKLFRFHEFVFYHILNIFHQQTRALPRSDIIRDRDNFTIFDPLVLIHRRVRLADRILDLAAIEFHRTAVSFYDFHNSPRSSDASVQHLVFLYIFPQKAFPSILRKIVFLLLFILSECRIHVYRNESTLPQYNVFIFVISPIYKLYIVCFIYHQK